MAYIGLTPSAAPLTSSDVTDGIITNAKLAQDIISAETALTDAPADTDEFLVSDAGTLKRIDYSLIKGGGLSVADQWRITSNFSISGTSLANLTSNFERVDTGGQGVIGAMSESSGIFSIPSTGYYWIIASFVIKSEGTDTCHIDLQTTVNNSSYGDAAKCRKSASATVTETSGPAHFLFDVTDTDNCKVKFNASSFATSSQILGDSGNNISTATFIKLGDT